MTRPARVRRRILEAPAPASHAVGPERAVQFSEPLGLFVEATFEAGAFAAVRILRDASPTAPHPSLARLLAHVERGEGDLRDLPVRLDVPAFHARVLERLRAIPRGHVVTYGELARELGGGLGAARAVGGACAANPLPLAVPCHRVVAANGALGNYSGEGGPATKRRLLEIEGAVLRQARLR